MLQPGWNAGLSSYGSAYGHDAGGVTERAVSRMFRSRDGDAFANLESGKDIVKIKPIHDINWVVDRINNLQAQISGASISAVCNEDGTITVTLTWG